MGQISVSLPSDGETIDAADYNTPINTVVNEINGNIDNSNIASDAAIAGTKLADGGVTNAKLSTATGEPGAAWQTYDPNPTGFSSTSTKVGKYIQVGKSVTVFVNVVGTSNANSKFFALPVAANEANDNFFGLSTNSDSGVNYMGAVVYRTSGSNVQAYRGFTGGSGTQFSGWTASGAASFSIRFTYEAA